MKSLIIGGTGFVGGYLVRHLVCDYGHDVIVTRMSDDEPCIEGVPANTVSYRNLNILELDEIIKLLNEQKPDYIFHLAAQSSVKVSWDRPDLTVDVNIKGALNVLEALKSLDYKPRTLLVGSGEEYGQIEAAYLPIKENTPAQPENIYAVTKLCQNYLGKIYADAFGLNIVMVRAFNHIGPNQLPVFAVADFCKQVAEIEAGKKEPVIKVGNLSAARDFTDVRDVVSAYVLLALNGVSGETYNVGSGKAIVLKDILNMILEESHVEIKVVEDKEKFRPVDVPIVMADVSKIEKETGWERKIELRETVKETLDYWRSKN